MKTVIIYFVQRKVNIKHIKYSKSKVTAHCYILRNRKTAKAYRAIRRKNMPTIGYLSEKYIELDRFAVIKHNCNFSQRTYDLNILSNTTKK